MAGDEGTKRAARRGWTRTGRKGAFRFVDQNGSVIRDEAAIERVAAEPDVRVVVVGGAGRAFCSGIDLDMLWDAADLVDEHIGDEPVAPVPPRIAVRAAQRKLRYASVLADDREIPAWIDEVLRRAVHPDPKRRYAELSEFVYDLRHPNAAWLSRARAPLLDRNPVAFWRGVSLILAVALVAVLIAGKLN